MGMTLFIALSHVAPGQAVYVSISDASADAAIDLSVIGGPTLIRMAADHQGNAKGPLLIPSAWALGDYLFEAKDLLSGATDQFTIVVQQQPTYSSAQFAVVSYSYPINTLNAGGSRNHYSMTIKNLGQSPGTVTLIQSPGSTSGILTTEILPGATYTHTAETPSISGPTELFYLLRATPFGNFEYEDQTRVFLINAKDSSINSPSQIAIFEADLIPGFQVPGQGIANHVPVPGENPDVVYPVDQYSNAQDILQALVDSGVWANFTAQQQTAIFANPGEYLNDHFSLNLKYPAFFAIKAPDLAGQPIDVTTNPDANYYDMLTYGYLARRLGLPLDPSDAFMDLWNSKIIGPFLGALEGLSTSLGVAGPVTPDAALARAITVSGTNMAIGFGIYLTATLTDLLQPFKGTGLVPMAIDLSNKLGTDLMTRGIVGTYAKSAIELPLQYHFNKLARPYRNTGQLLDQMLFESHISIEKWQEGKQLAGWTDDEIQAWFQTMFIEPSDRLLLSMFEDPEVPEAWIRQMLQQRGYHPDDIDVIATYGKRKAQDRTRLTRQAISITRLKKGYVIRDSFMDELTSIGFREDQAAKVYLQAELERDTDYRDEQRKIFVLAFQKGVFSEEVFREALESIIEDVEERQRTFNLEVLRKLPSPKKVPIAAQPIAEQQAAAAAAKEAAAEETKVEKLTSDLLVLEFRAGVISSAQLRTELSKIIDNPSIVDTMVKIEETRKLKA